MERPPSQLENVRPSGIKPPSSRLPTSTTTASRALHETSHSELNSKTARDGGHMLPPTSIATTKHKINGLPESVAKRKTLVERAGETHSLSRSHASQPRSTAHRTATTLHHRNAHSTSSNIGRPPSAQSMARSAVRYHSKRGNDNLDGNDDHEEDALSRRQAWDTSGRLDDMDKVLAQVQSQMGSAAEAKASLDATVTVYKDRVNELTQANRELSNEQRTAAADLERARHDLHITTIDLQQARKDFQRDQDDLSRQHEVELHALRIQHDKQIHTIEVEGEQAIEKLEAEVKASKQDWEQQASEQIADLNAVHLQELDAIKAKHEVLLQALRKDIEMLKRSDEGRATESALQVESLRSTIASVQAQNEALEVATRALQQQIAASESRTAVLEQEKVNLISKAHFLEGNQEAQSQEFSDMTHRLQAAEAKAVAVTEQLRREETVRRRLNAQVLELKGNIRVFARLRPVLENEEDPVRIEFPDAQELDGKKELLFHAPTTKTATGKDRNEKYNFAFDRVFDVSATNTEVFAECSELVQSVIDGYNVSILSYGQTGSGKTFGMSGVDGIIPSSITMLLSEIERLKGKDWSYEVEASFVEVYNDTLNDLLGDAKTWDKEGDVSIGLRSKSSAKHEIHHDSVTGKTTVSNLTTITLWPPPNEDADLAMTEHGVSQEYTRKTVERLLETATKNRRVAATKANERSSRSHSVFTLVIKGSCMATGEISEGVLNLVDLAGSERLKHSGAEGTRAKETAAINTSLKSLGDVIEKVGTGAHIPYRNSKLTYLLQSSLGGCTANGKSSRTLLMLHLSPLQGHWQETKTSLQFGAKVHGTHIGTAKKQKAVNGA